MGALSWWASGDSRGSRTLETVRQGRVPREWYEWAFPHVAENGDKPLYLRARLTLLATPRRL